MTFEKCPAVMSAAPDWYFWCTFRFYRIIVIVAAIPYLAVNIGEWLDLFYTKHPSMLDGVLKGYLSAQLSSGVVRIYN